MERFRLRFGEGAILLIALVLLTAGCFALIEARRPAPETYLPRHEMNIEMPLTDLNAADVGKLSELPGIGPALAERIVEWRNENGAFVSVDQLMEIEGIGKGKFKVIRELVCVKG